MCCVSFILDANLHLSFYVCAHQSGLVTQALCFLYLVLLYDRWDEKNKKPKIVQAGILKESEIFLPATWRESYSSATRKRNSVVIYPGGSKHVGGTERRNIDFCWS